MERVFFNHISDLFTVTIISPTTVDITNDTGSADIYGRKSARNSCDEMADDVWELFLSGYSPRVSRAASKGGPHNKFNVGLRGEWDNGLSAEAIYHYYGSVTYPIGRATQSLADIGLVTPPNPTVGSYNLLNLRGAYRFWQQKAAADICASAEVAISVFNALDDKAKEYPLGEEIGRRIMGWLTVRF